MSGIAGDLLLTIGAAAAGFGSSWLTNRRSNKTEAEKTLILGGKLELENRREDGAAYERASRINQQIVDGLREELTALQETIRELRADLTLKDQENASLVKHIRSLEASAGVMRKLLAQAGIEYSENDLEGTD